MKSLRAFIDRVSVTMAEKPLIYEITLCECIECLSPLRSPFVISIRSRFPEDKEKNNEDDP